MTKKSDLRNLLKRKSTLVLPGVFNAITARLAERLGFEALYVSGAGLSNGLLGLPDIGLLELEELTTQVRYMANVVKIPLVVDADTGYGEGSQIITMVRDLEKAGASAIQIEDQRPSSKRCGHLSGKKLIGAREMVEKIRQVCRARRWPQLMVIARTDARSVEGLAGAIQRAQLYREAGADIIFPEALESRQEFKKFALEVQGPLMANMTEFGKTPYISIHEFKTFGYSLVIFPMTAFRVMMQAVRDCLIEVKIKGTQKGFLPRMQTRKELYDLMGYERALGDRRL